MYHLSSSSYPSGSTTTSTTSLVRSATPPSPILRSATPPRTVFPSHAQEDLTAHAKLDVRERALVGLEGWGHAIKAAIRNADVSEELNKTARAFTSVDANVRSTQQSLEKITASMTQLQDRTTTLLDSLRLVTQISESLPPQDMIERKPPETPSGGGILSGTASNVVGVLGRFVG